MRANRRSQKPARTIQVRQKKVGPKKHAQEMARRKKVKMKAAKEKKIKKGK
tara:strand:- start:2471 stop:2623 length:153 start_codon:yes stop_codon:yes gene_type:complete